MQAALDNLWHATCVSSANKKTHFISLPNLVPNFDNVTTNQTFNRFMYKH